MTVYRGNFNYFLDGAVPVEVKQLGPRLALGWVTIQGLDVDAVQ